jgi:hypothetical protein
MEWDMFDWRLIETTLLIPRKRSTIKPVIIDVLAEIPIFKFFTLSPNVLIMYQKCSEF